VRVKLINDIINMGDNDETISISIKTNWI
jgi:hypothetical protein